MTNGIDWYNCACDFCHDAMMIGIKDPKCVCEYCKMVVKSEKEKKWKMNTMTLEDFI